MSVAQQKVNICHGAVATITLGGTDLGPVSENGVKMTISNSFFDHKNDQAGGTIKKTLIDRKAEIAFELTEASLARLHMSLNLATADLSGSTLTISDDQAADAIFSVVGQAPGGSARTAIFDAVQVVSNGELLMSKNGPAVLPITMEALYDTTNSRFGIIGDA